jgi:epoxide hydrolase-like predicted phosphatase
MTIRAIIFDLGGVLLRTADFSPREQLASSMGMNRDELEELIFGGKSGVRAQKGEISVEEHLEYVRNKLGCSREDFKEVLDIYFAEDVLDFDLVDYVRNLHIRYNTALLSNSTSDLRERIAEKWHFEDAFDSMIISGEVGVSKPDPRIFRLALDKLGVNAHEAIFVDDVADNVEAAKAAGMNAIQFKTPAQVRREIEQFLHSG